MARYLVDARRYLMSRLADVIQAGPTWEESQVVTFNLGSPDQVDVYLPAVSRSVEQLSTAELWSAGEPARYPYRLDERLDHHPWPYEQGVAATALRNPPTLARLLTAALALGEHDLATALEAAIDGPSVRYYWTGPGRIGGCCPTGSEVPTRAALAVEVSRAAGRLAGDKGWTPEAHAHPEVAARWESLEQYERGCQQRWHLTSAEVL